jgi:hypothetical protein
MALGARNTFAGVTKTKRHCLQLASRTLVGVGPPLLLVIAAIAKGVEQLYYPFIDGRFFGTFVTAVLIVYELLLAVSLLTFRRSIIPSLFAGFTFSGFAITSLYLALSGVSSCGCFGAIPVNPLVTFILDIGALAFVIMSYGRSLDQRVCRAVSAFAVGVLLLLPVVFVLSRKPVVETELGLGVLPKN